MMNFGRLARIAKIIALTAGVSALTGSCSKDEGPSLAEQQAACTTVASSICGRITRCNVAYRFQRDYGSDAECLAQEKGRCFRQITRPKTAHTLEYQKACSAARVAQTCPDFLNGAPLPACDMPIGPLKLGEACVDVAQCQSKYCKVPQNASCGVCADRAKEGAACAGSGDCLETLFCLKTLPADLMGTCAKRAIIGEACNTNTGTKACLADLVCSGQRTENMLPVDGTCQARTAKVGEPCNDTKVCLLGLACVGFDRAMAVDGMCQTLVATEGAPCNGNNRMLPNCDGNYNLYCQAMVNTCAKRAFAQTGGQCNQLADNSLVSCDKGDGCVRPLDATTMTRPPAGTCTARVGEGKPCFTDGNEGPTCLPGLSCIPAMLGAPMGVCTWRDAGKCLMTTSQPYMSMAPAAAK